MSTQKIANALTFYIMAAELKDKIRSGWKIWNVSQERLESVAEHIYGTCILAIALDSELDLDLDLNKSIMMLVLHELEEIIIGDLTPFDALTEDERRLEGEKAVRTVLNSLTKKDEYLKLLYEFEERKTPEAKFARMCDKLECDIQVKLYCEKGNVDLFSEKNEHLTEKPDVKDRIISHNVKNLAELFIEHDRKYFTNNQIEEVLNFVKANDLLKLRVFD